MLQQQKSLRKNRQHLKQEQNIKKINIQKILMKFTHQEKVNSGDEKLGIFLNRHPPKFSWYQIPLYPLALREITEQLKWKPVL